MPCLIGVIWAEKERKRMERIQKILKTEDCNERPQVLLNIFLLLNIYWWKYSHLISFHLINWTIYYNQKGRNENIARIAKAIPSHSAVLGCIGLNWTRVVNSVVFWESISNWVMELLLESNDWFVKFPIQIRVPNSPKYQTSTTFMTIMIKSHR